jgi:polyphosphate kinase
MPGISDRITVRSILGRFLEHSRLFWFANGGNPKLFIGSADVMERNLDRRVEVLCPVLDPAMAEHLRDVVLGAYLHDACAGTLLTSSGAYVRDAAPDQERKSAQQRLMDWHMAEAKGEA